MTTQDKIRSFIVENFLFGDTTQDLSDNVSLIENNIIDSTGVLELVGFVETTFDVVVEDADIVPANFDTIGKLAGFIASKSRVAELA